MTTPTPPIPTAGLLPAPPSPADTAAHLETLAATHPADALIELRLRDARTGCWSQYFPTAADHTTAARIARTHADTHDVYIGALLRRHAGGRRRDLTPRGHLVWIDLDTPTTPDPLDGFPLAPSLIVASGTPGHRHLYWRLDESVGLDEIEAVNRALARRLGGDLHATDAPRILRLAGTRNHKTRPATNVQLLTAPGPAVRLDQMRRTLGLAANPPATPELPAPPKTTTRPRASAPPTVWRHTPDSPIGRLEAIPPVDYVGALTGQPVPVATRKVRCPLHEDDTPSLHAYESPEDGWFCFGCRRGGRIYDLAAAMTHRSLRGGAFLDLQRDLVALLIEHDATVPRGPRGYREPRRGA